MDIAKGAWDPELLELFGGIPERSLPEVRPSCGVLGTTRADEFHGFEVPVSGVAGDQQAALFGQRCLEPGLGKNTYGTGSFVLANAGTSVPKAEEGLLATIAWQIGRIDHLRARGGDLRHRRRGAVAARRPRDHLRGGGDRGAGRPRWTPTTASTSSPR